TELDAATAGFDADEAHGSVLEEFEKEADGIRTAADTGDHLVRKTSLARENLLLGLEADDPVKLAHHHWIGVRAQRRAEDVMRVADIGDPVAHSLVDRLLQRALPRLDPADLGSHHPHAKHVQRLSLHVDGTHV